MTEEERLAAEAAAAETAAAEAAAAEAAATAAAATAAAEKAAADKAKTAEERQAELDAATEELEALKTKLAEFDGVDPVEAKANAKKIADAEKVAKEAAAAAKVAEKAKAQAENDIEKLTKIQKDEYDAAIAAVTAERDTARTEATSVSEQLNRVRLENAFNSSKFISEETILTGGKAQRLFSDYVEIVDGQPVVYDSPAGTAKRAKVMDSKGVALPFNEAITKVINADPDKDSLLKTKTKPGAGTKTVDGKPADPANSRHNRLAAGLAALREKNAR